jgi:hypothetical protein
MRFSIGQPENAACTPRRTARGPAPPPACTRAKVQIPLRICDRRLDLAHPIFRARHLLERAQADAPRHTLARETPLDLVRERRRSTPLPLDATPARRHSRSTPLDAARRRSTPLATPLDAARRRSTPLDAARRRSPRRSTPLDAARRRSPRRSPPLATPLATPLDAATNTAGTARRRSRQGRRARGRSSTSGAPRISPPGTAGAA